MGLDRIRSGPTTAVDPGHGRPLAAQDRVGDRLGQPAADTLRGPPSCGRSIAEPRPGCRGIRACHERGRRGGSANGRDYKPTGLVAVADAPFAAPVKRENDTAVARPFRRGARPSRRSDLGAATCATAEATCLGIIPGDAGRRRARPGSLAQCGVRPQPGAASARKCRSSISWPVRRRTGTFCRGRCARSGTRVHGLESLARPRPCCWSVVASTAA